jgi:hypothetical protein
VANILNSLARIEEAVKKAGARDARRARLRERPLAEE